MSPELEVPAGLAAHRFPAMGTEVLVLAPAARAAGAARAVEALFEEWERTLSRFRPESDLSRLNAAAGSAVTAGRVLLDAVAAALAGARATDGLFDPLLERDLVRIGYDRPFGERLQPEPAAAAARPGGGWRDVLVDTAAGTVRLPAGRGLDLGGIAKGMTVDAALDRLDLIGARPALVSAGGDLAVRGTPPEREAWDVLVGEEPGGPVVRLAAGALATSGSERRRWRQGTVARHHLVDPRTGEPSRAGLRRVTVAAGSCRAAEVAATAAFVAGPVAGAALLRRHGLAGLLVTDTGEELTAGPWPVASTERAPGLAGVA